MAKLLINGKSMQVDASEDTPLLWVLRDHLGITRNEFGCGVGLCGACTVHIDGGATRSCETPISAMGEKDDDPRIRRPRSVGEAVENAWMAVGVPQCGYCQGRS